MIDPLASAAADTADALERLRHSQRMEAIGRLAGGIAHDFNNLLTAIQGYSEMALARLAPDDPVRPYLEEICRATDRAASLTRRLLAFGRSQAAQPQALSLNAVVTDIGSMLRRLIVEDVELVTSLDAELGNVRADPGQMEQLLMNLVLNARDAMPGGGKLTIATRNAEIAKPTPDGIPAGHYAVLSVSDTGDGMAPAVRERIFEAFFTTKAPEGGTGLGLASVQSIVQQSGGYIRVESAPGQGSTFEIYLPPTSAEPEADAPRDAPAADGGAGTVLLVEDDGVVVEIVRQLLEAQGYTVLAAADGIEALALARRHQARIDLVFTDIVMPRMNGSELVAELRRRQPGIRVVYTSGYPEGVRRAATDAHSTFLQKPFTPAGLSRAVRQALAERPAA
jgi:nitrogen-specific signal transduction histidine kinase/CheY-like chemotaxis protein